MLFYQSSSYKTHPRIPLPWYIPPPALSLNKAAQIYIAAKNMGFEPEGMTDAQLQEMTDAFGLPK